LKHKKIEHEIQQPLFSLEYDNEVFSKLEPQDQHILTEWKNEYSEKTFFANQDIGSEVHWFFTQALQALKCELYLPACSSFLNGIEASLRVTLRQLEHPGRVKALDRKKTLSNMLLKCALEAGLPVRSLAFPVELDFLTKLETKPPQLVNVEVVRIRHNLCHGNILEYINTALGEDNAFFTPECCRELAYNLYHVSKIWVTDLSKFRSSAEFPKI
jgi:hypothetical protein